MAYNQRTWTDFVDQVDAANFNDLESRINSAVSSAVSAISNSQTMLSGTVKLSGAGAVSVGSQTGNAFTISAPVQTVQTQGLVGAISYSNTTKDGTVRVTGAGNITVASDASGAVVSGSQSVQTQNLVRALSYSDATKDQTVRITGAGDITVASDASGAVVSGSQSLQTQSIVRQVTLSGNTAGALAAISSGTLTLAGGNNVTVSQAGNAVTISGANAGGVQTGISSIAATNTTYTSGQVEFTGSNMVTVKSSANQRVVIDATQTVQTQSMVNAISYSDATKSGTVRITGAGDITVGSDANGAVISGSQSAQPVGSLSPAGNTTGTTANLPFAGNVQLAAGNNLTLSQSSGASSTRVTLSAASQSVQPGVQNLVASDATFSSGTVTVTGAGDITVNTAAGKIQVSGSQSVQPVGSASAAGNTTGTLTAVPLSGNLGIAGGNNITISQSTGANSTNLTISGANVGGAQTGISSIGASNTTYTSGEVDFTGSNIVTVKSSAGQRVVIDASTSQSVQPVGSLDLAGNTTGTMATLPFASNLELAGGNNVTLSQSSGASSSRITISAASQSVQPVGSLDLAGNTTGTMATIPFASNVELAGGNNITLSQSSGASSSRITISGAALPAAQTGISSIAASNTTYTSGQVEFTGSNAASVKSSANQRVVIDVPTQTAQTQSNIQGVAGSNTTYNTGTVELTGSNMVTVKSSANQRLVIDATQSVQPVGSVAPGGNTSGTTASLPMSGNVGIVGGPNLTVSQSTGAASTNLSLSVAAQSVQPVGSVAAAGNTTGTMGTLPLSGSIGIAGGPNITISQSTGGASTNLTISAPAPGGGAGFTLSGSDTTYTNSAVLTGSNALTVRSTTGNKFVFDAPVQTTQPGVQNLVASDATFSSGTVSVSGTNNLTVATSASKIVISGANTTQQTVQTQSVNPKMPVYRNVDPADVVALSHLSAISKTPLYFGVSLPGDMTLNTIGVRLSNVATGTLQSFSVHLGVYTQVNSTSAALLGSASDSYNVSTASSASFSGVRDWVLTSPSTQTAISTLSAGRYVFGMMFSGAATGSMHLSLLGQSGSTAGQPLGAIAPGNNALSTGTSQGINALVGQGSTTVNALPANVSAGDIRNQGTATVPLTPGILIRS